MQKERDLSFDAFRGIAIIAVVAIHAIPWQLYRDYVVLSYHQLLNFVVPAFLFISGYWLSKKPISSLVEYKSFLQMRFSRILVPYLFWSLVYLGYEVLKTQDISVTQMLYRLLTGGASVHFYFIIVIAQLYILTPLLKYLNCKPYGFISVIILNIIVLFILYHYHLRDFGFDSEISGLIRISFFPWVVFYQFGLFIGSRDSAIGIPRSMYGIILFSVLASLTFSDWEALFVLSKFDNWQMAICALKYSSFTYSLCVILGFLCLRNYLKTWPRVLIILGNYSFGIYLIHMIIIRGIVKVLRNVDLLYSFQPLYEFMIVSMTLLICYSIIVVSRQFLPRPICKKVLGF